MSHCMNRARPTQKAWGDLFPNVHMKDGHRSQLQLYAIITYYHFVLIIIDITCQELEFSGGLAAHQNGLKRIEGGRLKNCLLSKRHYQEWVILFVSFCCLRTGG